MGDRYRVGVACDLGSGPEAGGREWNEDNFLVVQDGRARWRESEGEVEEPLEATGLMVAVADGMGGHARGDIASLAAVRALTRLVRAGQPEEPEDALARFVQHAHGRLYDQAAAQGVGRMGTTLTVAWILEGRASWAQVGDSRLWLLRGDQVAQLSRDQTRAELAARDGRPPPRDPGALVQGFIYGSRGLGDDRRLRLDPGKDTGTLRLAVGDRLLLSSDGLHGPLAESTITDLLRAHDDPRDAAGALVARAIASGSDDNLTAVVLVVDELEPRAGGGPLVDITTLVPME